MDTHGMTVIERDTMEAIQSLNQKIPDVELRDLFAMSALQGSLANPNTFGDSEDFAIRAYDYADEMLKARKRK